MKKKKKKFFLVVNLHPLLLHLSLIQLFKLQNLLNYLDRLIFTIITMNFSLFPYFNTIEIFIPMAFLMIDLNLIDFHNTNFTPLFFILAYLEFLAYQS
jgi:hypothetical protein